MAILHDIYRVPDQWQDATNCYWTKGMDTTSGKRVFIKEYKNLRYRNNPDASPLYRRINDRLDAYCRKTLRIMSEVNRIAGSGGDVVVSNDFFREGVMIYKVTELVDKVDWKPEDVHRHLTVRQIDDLMLRLTNAISALHSANILHCDLKPENVFIVEREGRYIGMVSDFDDSFFLDDIPAPDQVVGTPEYFSPELGYYKSPDRRPEMTARLPLTPASDMFSLGLIYHKYLTGEDPKIDEKHRGQVWNALFEEGGSYTLGGGLDAAHCALIRRLLYCYPSGRIANCTELAAEINKIRNARTTYALRAMIGDAPARNRTLALYGEIPCGEGGQKVLECLQNVRTDEKGVALLTGLPAEQKLKLRKGDGYEDIEWDADHA